MATIPTQNPVPSEAAVDLKFNTGKIDEFVTSFVLKYTDRLGRDHLTIEGIRDLVEKAIKAFGFITMDSFEDGATLDNSSQVLRWESNGEYYRWDGSFPKVVPTGSTPATTGGIGTSAWVSIGDAALRSQLSQSTGATLVGYGDSNVSVVLDSLKGTQDRLVAKTGFNEVGRFLNLTELRAQIPSAAGQIVYVSSASSATATEKHYGGGYFQSFDNGTSPIADDGGVVIVPATGSLAWRRINFTLYDMCFWGVKPDGATDNAEAITKATNYARSNRIILDAPAGNIHTSEMVPIYSNCGIRGQGIKAEGTVFYKTTNNKFQYKNGTTTVIEVDSLVGFVPNKYDLSDPSMESFCVHARLEACMFRRLGLTESNVAAVRPAFGLHLSKVGAGVIKQVAIEGGYIGVSWNNCFSTVMEMVSATQYAGFGYSGFSGQDVRSGVCYMTGTSIDMRLCQCTGYQFGFDISRLEYSTMTNCTAEAITPMAGETVCYAFQFTDPYSIAMNTCATEFVKGGQIRILPAPNPSFARSLVVTGYLPIDQQNPVAPTTMYSVDSGALGSVKVTFIGGDLARQTSNPNSIAPVVSGSNAKVVIINSGGEDWSAVSGGKFTRIA